MGVIRVIRVIRAMGVMGVMGKGLVLEPGLSSKLADIAGRGAGDRQPSSVLRF